MEQLKLNFHHTDDLISLLNQVKEELLYQERIINDMNSSVFTIRKRAMERYYDHKHQFNQLLNQLGVIL